MTRISAGTIPLAAGVISLFACRELANRPEQRSAFAVADSLSQEGRASLSTPKYLALRDSFALLRDTAQWWRAQLWLADGLHREGKRDSALAELAKASGLAKGNPNRIGWTLSIQSLFMERAGHFDSALTTALRAQTLARETRDPKLEAKIYHRLGAIYSLSGRYQEALATHQRSIEMLKANGATPRERALEQSELAIDYRHLGRFTEAVANYDSALKVERSLARPEGIARVEFNLAVIRAESGEPDEALALLSDALRFAEQIGEVRGIAFIHGGLGDLYFRAQAYKAAREHYDKALSINRTARLPYGEAQNLEGIGRIELAEGNPAAAIPVLRSARAIADSAPFGKERVTTRAGLARAYAARGAIREALSWADQAVRIADSLGDPAAVLEARAARGVALEKTNEDRAAADYLAAMDLLESWRGRLTLGDLRMGVADSHLDVYEGAIRSLLKLGRSREAFQVAERARARLLLELMAERNNRDARRSREDTLRQLLREKFASREDLKGPRAAAVDREIDALTNSLDSVQAVARARDVRAGVVYPAPASIKDLQSGLLSPDKALVMFFWGEKDVYGWWMTSSEVRAAKLGASDSLAAMVEFLNNALSQLAAGHAWQASAKSAFARFVTPLHPSSASEILIVADGPLAYAPLEAFIPEGNTPWGSTTRFIYGPSASVLLALQRAPPLRSWSREVLAVGNPHPRSSRFASFGDNPTRVADSLLPDLPAAAVEARNIASLLGGDAITGDKATLGHWLSLDPARYRYLHFATHTLFDDEHPQRTALLMADGQLDLDRVRRLRLSSDLVTLSACETALGQQLRGEGVIGFPHAFLAAGAHGVVMTLWRVSDRVAERYMEDLYRELRAGRAPAEAMLLVRQKRIAAGGVEGQPSQWAPFVLVGGFTGDQLQK